MKRSLLAAVLVPALIPALSACSGPAPSFTISGHDVPINVAFGAAAPGDTRAPAGPTQLVPVPSGLGVIPGPLNPPAPSLASGPAPVIGVPPSPGAHPPTGGPTRAQPAQSATPRPGQTIVVTRTVPYPSRGAAAPLPVPPPCPALDPFSVSRQEAETEVVNTAPNGSFPYTLTGSQTLNGVMTPVNTVVASTVSNAALGTDAAGRTTASFTLTQTAMGVTTVRDFGYTGPVQGHLGSLVLTDEKSTSTPGYTATFTPEPGGLTLLQTPTVTGATFNDAKADPVTATAAAVMNATLVGRERVNACGKAIDAFKVTSTVTITNAQENITNTRTDWFATQYGGLPVQEMDTFTGTTGATMTPVSGSLTWDIRVDPGGSK